MKTDASRLFFRPGTVEWDSCLRWWMTWCARVQRTMKRSYLDITPDKVTFNSEPIECEKMKFYWRPVAWLREQRQ